MTKDQIRTAFLTALTQVAPDLDAAAVSDDDHLQQDLELDSMDILNLVAALHRDLGVDIPELDYPRIATPGLAVAYLAERLG
ncbi:MAG: acyl carrier protein [Pseudodonghicola sp.]